MTAKILLLKEPKPKSATKVLPHPVNVPTSPTRSVRGIVTSGCRKAAYVVVGVPVVTVAFAVLWVFAWAAVVQWYTSIVLED